jgi:hypothetical protein
MVYITGVQSENKIVKIQFCFMLDDIKINMTKNIIPIITEIISMFFI